jgi:hypothetical protein
VGALVVAGVDGARVFEFARHVHGPMPLAIECLVKGYLDFPVCFRGYADFQAALGKAPSLNQPAS